MTDHARKLVEDLRESGIVRGSDGRSQKTNYPPSSRRGVDLRSVDPQDKAEVEEAFHDAQEALLRLGEALLRAGPPSTSGAGERLAWVRGALDELEQALGLDPAPRVQESVDREPDYVTKARVALQRSEGLLMDARRFLRDRGRDTD